MGTFQPIKKVRIREGWDNPNVFQIYTLNETKNPKDAKGVVMIDQKDWKIYDGLHEAVKTQEEHDFIVMHLARKTKIAKGSTAKETYPLTKT